MNKLLASLLCCFLISSITAQQLQHTSWKTVTKGGTDTNIVIATADTLYLNGPTGSNLVTALFEENGNTILIRDLSGPVSCVNPDTGHYSFNISNDTLVFSLIYDSCGSRAFVLDGAVLWRNNFPTATIETRFNESLLSVFPNPSNGQITIITEENGIMEIRNPGGKIVCKTSITKGRSTWDTQLSDGIYILLYKSKTNLVRELITVRE